MTSHLVRKTTCVLLAIAVTSFSSATLVEAGVYQDFVNFLEPSYYYQLNEMDADGEVIDSTGNAPFGSFNGDYENGPAEIGIPGPDFLLFEGAWTESEEWGGRGVEIPIVGLGEGNTAHASNDAGHINLGDQNLFGAPAMTVSMFARGGGNPQGGARLFTNNLVDATRSFQINVGNDGLVVSVDPSFECAEPFPDNCRHKSLFLPGEGDAGFSNQGVDRGLISPDNGWWHIVASTEGNTSEERAQNIRLWLNGVDRTADMKPGTTGWGQDTTIAKIGGRRADATDSTTHDGAQDEVAIWLGRVLTDEEAFSLFLAATDPDFPPPGDKICDFDGNDICDVNDLDELLYLGQVSQDPKYDLDESGTVDLVDRDVWLANEEVNSFPGDFDLNGRVVAADLNTLGGNWTRTDLTSWAQGDSDGDGDADAGDLNALGSNWQAGVAAAAAVPEPTGIVLSLLGLLGLLMATRKR